MNKHRYMKEIEYIINGNHISSYDIFKKLKQTYPLLGIWTVYRNLRELVEKWSIMKTLWILEQTLYETAKAPHGHLVCKHSKKIFDISLEQVDFSQLVLPHWFHIEEIHLSFVGVFSEEGKSCIGVSKKVT